MMGLAGHARSDRCEKEHEERPSAAANDGLWRCSARLAWSGILLRWNASQTGHGHLHMAALVKDPLPHADLWHEAPSTTEAGGHLKLWSQCVSENVSVVGL